MEGFLDVALRVGEALERTGAAYFIGGSFASSFQGEPRATNDLDFVVDLDRDQVAPLVEALGPDFSVDEESLLDAVDTRGSWNIFFSPTGFKIDLFIRRSSPFDDAEFSRRHQLELRPGRHVWIKAAEDTVLRKLLWFQAGGGVSTTQWRDIVQVLRISGPTMDLDYAERWAADLGLAELFAKARAASALR